MTPRAPLGHLKVSKMMPVEPVSSSPNPIPPYHAVPRRGTQQSLAFLGSAGHPTIVDLGGGQRTRSCD